MKYINANHTEEKLMLTKLKLKNLEELFKDIPDEIRLKTVDIPVAFSEGKSELEVKRELESILARNKNCNQLISFLGAGIYHHYIPAIVTEILSRAEFYTAYTPYQPEISQGILQAIFEYQSLICELTGMDVVNASMYDSATALGEAVRMCLRIQTQKKKLKGNLKFVIPEALAPNKLAVLNAYTRGTGIEFITVPYNRATGVMELDFIKSQVVDCEHPPPIGIYVEIPNFFGLLEEPCLSKLKSILRPEETLLIVGINHPLVLALVKSPGELGADIMIAEGQPLGNPMNYGGPLLGIFGCKLEYVRQMPGRLVGLTRDATNRRAFCLTLQTREQHIRRERATSNICTNESLCAIATAVYIVTVGKRGLIKLAKQLYRKSHYLANQLDKLSNFELKFKPTDFFIEFVLRTEFDCTKLYEYLLNKNILAGVKLYELFPELKNCLLLAVTEYHKKADLDKLIKLLNEYN